MGDLALDSTPEMTGTTGLDGRFLLANRPAGGGTTTQTGHTLVDNPFGLVDVVGSRNHFLVRVQQGTHEEFHWLNITDFNLAYWQGAVVSHTLTIATHVPPAAAPAPPTAAVATTVEGSAVTLCWSASTSPAVIDYNVYRAAAPMFAYELAAERVAATCLVDIDSGDRVYAITAVDSADRESGFSNFVWVPRLINPTAIAFDGAERSYRILETS